MRRFLLCCLVLAFGLAISLAQPDPDNPQPDVPPGGKPPVNRPPAIDARAMAIAVTQQGFFIVNTGVLARLNPDDLKAEKTLELFGPMPKMPEKPVGGGPVDQAAYLKWAQERVKRSAPVAIKPTDDSLLIVIGTYFFRVNMDTMKIDAKTNLAGENGDPMNMMIGQTTPVMELLDDKLFIVRGADMAVVNITDGTLIIKGVMPKELVQANILPMPGGDLPLPPGGGDKPRPPAGGDKPRPPAGDPGKPRNPEGVEGRNITMMGTIQRVDVEGGLWTIKNERGEELVLEGERLAGLLRQENIAGRRVVVVGTYSTHEGAIKYGNGYLVVREFKIKE